MSASCSRFTECAALAGDCCPTVDGATLACCAAGLAVPSFGNNGTWPLLWHDEFDGESIDLNKWRFQALSSGHFNGELQRYVTAAEAQTLGTAEIRQGSLVLTARRAGHEVVSTRLNSAFGFIYGMVEMRGKLAYEDAVWTAFWMLHSEASWPLGGEVDILELFGHRKGKVVCAAFHMEAHHWPDSNPLREQCSDELTNLQPIAAESDWHTWRLFWSPSRISITLDATDPHDASDSRINCYERPSPDAHIDVWPFFQPLYLLANIAVGGNGVNGRSPSADWQSSSFILDHVRIYALPDNYTDGSICPPPELIGLQAWAITAIAVGSSLGALLIICLVVWLARRRGAASAAQAAANADDNSGKLPSSLSPDAVSVASYGSTSKR